MRLTFPGAATSTAPSVSFLTVAFIRAGIRAIAQRDLVFIQTVPERAGVELEEAGGFLLHAAASGEGFDEQVALDAVDQHFQIQSLGGKFRRQSAALPVGR